MKTELVDLQSISAQAVFPVHYESDSRPLKTSLKTFGLLNPLILYRQGEKLFVLDGLERCKILHEFGELQCVANIYEEAEFKADQAFLLYLELNRWSRPFNLAEKANALKIALDVFHGKNIPKSFWELVGISQNMGAMRQHKDFLKLPEMLKKFALNNHMPLTTMLLFLRFRPAEIEPLAARLFCLPLNQNKLAEVLSLLLDISRRDDRSALAILEEILPEIELKPGPQQKEQALRSVLHRKRNPNYEKRLRDFEHTVKKIPLGGKTKVVPAPYFEENYVEVVTRFSTPEDINDFAQTLKSESWSEVLKAVR